MDIGICVGCGAEEMELNDDGFCSACADLEGDTPENKNDLDNAGFEED